MKHVQLCVISTNTRILFTTLHRKDDISFSSGYFRKRKLQSHVVYHIDMTRVMRIGFNGVDSFETLRMVPMSVILHYLVKSQKNLFIH